MGNLSQKLCSRCEEQNKLHIHSRLSKFTRDYINQPVNPNNTILFTITLEFIIIGNSHQFHDGIYLNILFILLKVYRRCKKWKAFYAKEKPSMVDRTNKLLNFKNLNALKTQEIKDLYLLKHLLVHYWSSAWFLFKNCLILSGLL